MQIKAHLPPSASVIVLKLLGNRKLMVKINELVFHTPAKVLPKGVIFLIHKRTKVEKLMAVIKQKAALLPKVIMVIVAKVNPLMLNAMHEIQRLMVVMQLSAITVVKALSLSKLLEEKNAIPAQILVIEIADLAFVSAIP